MPYNIIRFCLITCLSFLLAFPKVFAGSAPDFSLQNNENNSQKLSDLKGHVIYLDFWASWCVPCKRSFPWMSKMQTKYNDKGFKVITVNLDKEHGLANEFLQELKNHSTRLNFPIIYDPKGKVALDYQLTGMPNSFLIDIKGEVRFSHKGFFIEKQSVYEDEILFLLKEKDVLSNKKEGQ